MRAPCGGGGIGRRASLRGWWASARGSSSLLRRTTPFLAIPGAEPVELLEESRLMAGRFGCPAFVGGGRDSLRAQPAPESSTRFRKTERAGHRPRSTPSDSPSIFRSATTTSADTNIRANPIEPRSGSICKSQRKRSARTLPSCTGRVLGRAHRAQGRSARSGDAEQLRDFAVDRIAQPAHVVDDVGVAVEREEERAAIAEDRDP